MKRGLGVGLGSLTGKKRWRGTILWLGLGFRVPPADVCCTGLLDCWVVSFRGAGCRALET